MMVCAFTRGYKLNVRQPAAFFLSRPQRKSAVHFERRRRHSFVKASFTMDGGDLGDESRATKGKNEAPGLVKRKVALHVGYVGTGYQGLQFSKQEHVKTIEADLIHAIHLAGLITDSNQGDLEKVKWSRSSRTDKGVHSLATVVALKVMMDETRYELDPEGIGLAQQITKHLPDEIAVFSVQRVNKHFRARHFCNQRTYRYYLPASALTEQHAPPGSVQEMEAVERFRKALTTMEGRHPFHNYTKMKKYRNNPMDSFRGPDKDWTAPAKKKSGGRPTESESEDQTTKKTKSRRKKATLDEDSDEDEGREVSNAQGPDELEKLAWGALTPGEIRTGRFRFWNFQFKEIQEAAKAGDVVVPAHYREVREFTASDPHPVIPGGVRAICVEVVGVSFMLHQIRYMISTAVCVARGFVSLPVLEATLNASIRVNLSLAPPHPLMLSSSRFRPFPGLGTDPATVSKWSGPELKVQSEGMKQQAAFNEQVLLPAINELLEKPEWETWSRNLCLFSYNEGMHDVAVSMNTFYQWHSKHLKAREERIAAFEERGIDKATYWKIQRENRAKQKQEAGRRGRKPDDWKDKRRKETGDVQEGQSAPPSIWGWFRKIFSGI